MSIAPTYVLNPDLSSAQLKDAISERLQQLQALASLCQSDDIADYVDECLANCFWLQSNLLRQITELFNAYIQKKAC